VLVVFVLDVELLVLELELELDDVEWLVCWDVVWVTVETVTVESIVTVTTEMYAPVLDLISRVGSYFSGRICLHPPSTHS
jgi:hypothetical protein